MKKVISALTAAAMCASMSASVMTAFAAYSANDASMYLQAIEAGKGVISEDGKTVTFATAADAANATIKVQTFLKADTENSTLAAFGVGVISSDKAIVPTNGVNYTAASDTTTDYTLSDGTAFSTGNFVHAFGQTVKRGKNVSYSPATATASWASSSSWEWDYTGYPALIGKWNGQLGADSTGMPFLEATSDALPISQFDVTVGEVAEGTYTVNFIETWENMKADEHTQPGTYVLDFDGTQTNVAAGSTGLTIVVGDPNATPVEPTTEETPVEPTTEETPVEPTTEQTPATPATPGETPKENIKDPASFSEETFYFDDVVYDIASDEGGIQIELRVAKNRPTAGVEGQFLINGGEPGSSPLNLSDIFQDPGYGIGLQVKTDVGKFAGALSAETREAGEKQLADGSSTVSFWIDIDENTPTGVYTLSLADGFKTIDFDRVTLNPALASGTLTIYNSNDPNSTPTEPVTDPVTPTDPPATDPVTPTDPPATDPVTPTDPPAPGDYIYGDVNKNGTVELVDIVMLNRFLTGFGGQTLDDYQTVVANCQRENGESDADTKQSDLNGKDSMAILRFLIGLESKLPV
jgi:hypothetical protein